MIHVYFVLCASCIRPVLCELAAVTYALLFGVGLQRFMMQCLVISLKQFNQILSLECLFTYTLNMVC